MSQLALYGFKEDTAVDEGNIAARVIAVHKERFELVCEHGTIHARLKVGIYFTGMEVEVPTVGDFVQIIYNSMGDSLITKTLPRSSYFSRRDTNNFSVTGEQAIAANFDYVFIVVSLNHDFLLWRIERYITQAWQSGATPVLMLTKRDLVEDFSQQLKDAQRIAPGVNVHAVSAVTGEGMEELQQYLQPRKTIVFLGSSGVGKSSLVNAIYGEDLMYVQNIREGDSKGRHTTTHRQLILLPSGVILIDTPGMRMLGMWDVSTGLSETFGDVEDFLGKCRFTDCTHGNEPDCAIKAALESGELDYKRWTNYLNLKREARYVDNKAAFIKAKTERNKNIAKWSKKREKSKRESFAEFN